jgi:23S rRNA (cytosine1962-C5)-methyltransferase
MTYSLVDSGALARLEQFGDKRIIRPSKFALWERRFPKEWKDADATYDHDRGWRFHGERFEEWRCPLGACTLVLRLQQNGQIGFFPEHDLYQLLISEFVSGRPAGMKVLNLFAYTGLATVTCTRAGAHVTHVDLSKKVNQWGRINLETNELGSAPVRFIQEDALSFLKKEQTRGNQYDLVIADPPTFSRVSAKETWDIDNVFVSLLQLIGSVLAPEGMVVLTSHRFELGEQVMANLAYDVFGERTTIESSVLSLQEEHTPRRLPAGYLVIARSSAS